MRPFIERLEQHAVEIDSLLCVGLDPHPEDLTESTAAAARDFCMRIVDATQDLAVAYKPNAAFFELYGSDGWTALADVIAAIPEATITLLDAKRGDIASTAKAYAASAFEGLGADAITINPYLGKDAVDPFISDPAHGIFLLCKTSNPGAGDLQDLQATAAIDGQLQTAPLYVHVAEQAQRWNQNNNIGLVVGATQLDSLERVREAAPDLWFLMPGVGPQGADLGAALGVGRRTDGLGMLVPVSRAVARAGDPRQAASDLRDAINEAR
jgi:uridine monophosphate synthetase